MVIEAQVIPSKLSMRRDAIYRSAASYSPQELIVLWQKMGRSVYGRRYYIWRGGDVRACRYWRTFVKLRALLVERRVSPVRYFQALFEYATFKRRHLTPGLLDLERRAAACWRPWPNQLCSDLYLSIYDSWEKRQLTDGTLEQALRDGRAFSSRRPLAAVVEDVAAACEMWSSVRDLYPGRDPASVLEACFRDLSPYFLYFLPEAGDLIRRGYGTDEQRLTFKTLDRSESARLKHRAIYELHGLPRR